MVATLKSVLHTTPWVKLLQVREVAFEKEEGREELEV